MQSKTRKPLVAWPKQRRLIGKDVQRVDGPEKSTGTAKYSFDINRPGMLHAQILRCPYAHAKIKKIDTSAAEKIPGFAALHMIASEGAELDYAGAEVLAIAADTEEHVQDALRAVRVEYEVLPFLVKEEDALKNPSLKTVSGRDPSNVSKPTLADEGDVDAAYKEADAVVEGEYGVATVCHHCLEPHGLVAEWPKEGSVKLRVWCSVQATRNVAAGLAKEFDLGPTEVECLTDYMGGGYGSKFGPDVQGIACSHLAKKTGRPVKLMLTREAEITTAGNRPSAYGRVKMAGKKDGTITAYEVDCYGTPGATGRATVNFAMLPYVYKDAIPNYRLKHTVILTNCGAARAMRAPGHPQNCLLTDTCLDDLAAKLGLDPMEVRLKNLPKNVPSAVRDYPLSWNAVRETIYRDEIAIAAKLAKWKEKWHPPGEGGKGPIKYGIGMALHTWGGGAAGGDPPLNECTVIISRDGSVTAQSSTQDLGTGQRTVTAMVVAEILGLEPHEVFADIGNSSYGQSTGSGGSTTCPSQAPSALRAAIGARDQLFAKIAKKLGAKPENLAIEPGKVVDTATGKSVPWKKACAMLGMDEVRVKLGWSSVYANEVDDEGKLVTPGVSNLQVGGVQIAEVRVDTETGQVFCDHIVAVQDVGMVVNKLLCESQVAGGVIMAVNYALLEDRIMDRHTGRQVNPDMEFYKLAGIQDIPRITVHMHDMPERGVIGIGEPPTISTAAAISNAIFNAIGVRVSHAPFTPDKVLAALAQKGGKA
ncbi:MAG: xanthine dehydrogenase family protein molybdopterin-binding subunit [Gemmataceae bacterium]